MAKEFEIGSHLQKVITKHQVSQEQQTTKQND